MSIFNNKILDMEQYLLFPYILIVVMGLILGMFLLFSPESPLGSLVEIVGTMILLGIGFLSGLVFVEYRKIESERDIDFIMCKHKFINSIENNYNLSICQKCHKSFMKNTYIISNICDKDRR